MDKWTELYVRAPEGNGYTNPQAIKRIDDHIFNFGAMFKCPPPSGMPIQEEDGTWELRVLNAFTLPMVKGILTNHYGLEIVREEQRSAGDQ